MKSDQTFLFSASSTLNSSHSIWNAFQNRFLRMTLVNGANLNSPRMSDTTIRVLYQVSWISIQSTKRLLKAHWKMTEALDPIGALHKVGVVNEYPDLPISKQSLELLVTCAQPAHSIYNNIVSRRSIFNMRRMRPSLILVSISRTRNLHRRYTAAACSEWRMANDMSRRAQTLSPSLIQCRPPQSCSLIRDMDLFARA